MRSLTSTQTTRSLYLGTFIHSKSLEELEFLHNSGIFVSENGKIVAIEPDCDQVKAEEVIFPTLGWSRGEVFVRVAKAGQFFFPGFIGLYSLCFGVNYVFC